MCHLCKTKPVYEFTNKRKLCARCFVSYFEKKVLYTIKKFGMIKREDVVGYKKDNSLKGMVLENILKFVSDKAGFNLVRFPDNKADKIAVASSIDSESENITKTLIEGNASDLKKYLPVYGRIIKPLYLFLEQEILLYAKIKKLKFSRKEMKGNKFNNFLNHSEEKHPEVKRAVVNSLLELYNKNQGS